MMHTVVPVLRSLAATAVELPMKRRSAPAPKASTRLAWCWSIF
jgi:hypothetical protein